MTAGRGFPSQNLYKYLVCKRCIDNLAGVRGGKLLIGGTTVRTAYGYIVR
jgi:hypothetical protein